MSDQIPDPVSPEPVTPSSPVTPPPEPSPAPEAEGLNTPAPPAASDQETKRLPEDNRPEEEEVLARLQGIDTTKDKEETPPAIEAPAEGAPGGESPKPDAEAKPAAEEFKLPDEAELNGYHSKTRDRFKGMIRHLDGVKRELADAKPFADYGAAVVGQARKLGVTNEQLNAWLETGFMLKQADPRALPALASILKQAGYKDPALAPPAAPAPAAPDLSALDAVIDSLHKDLSIDDKGALALKNALKTVVPAKPVAPAVQAPVQPQQPAVPPQVASQAAEYAQAVKSINEQLNEYAAATGLPVAEVQARIKAETDKIEAKLTPQQINNVANWQTRFNLAASNAFRPASAPPAAPPAPKPVTKNPPLTPSLRAQAPSTPRSPTATGPKPGTPEYEEALLEGRISVKR